MKCEEKKKMKTEKLKNNFGNKTNTAAYLRTIVNSMSAAQFDMFRIGCRENNSCQQKNHTNDPHLANKTSLTMHFLHIFNHNCTLFPYQHHIHFCKNLYFFSLCTRYLHVLYVLSFFLLSTDYIYSALFFVLTSILFTLDEIQSRN